MSLIGLVG